MRDSELRIQQKSTIIVTAFLLALFIASFALFMSYVKTVEEPNTQMNVANIRKQSVVGSKVIFGIAFIVLLVIFIRTAVKLNYFK